MNLASWFVDTISVGAATAAGIGTRAGDSTFGTAASVLGRLQKATKADTEIVAADHVFYTSTLIAEDSRVWLPGESTSDSTIPRRALRVETLHDKRGGFTYYKAFLGR